MSTFREKFIGAFDLVFFFGRGIKPFEKEGTKKAALESLRIQAWLYPLAPFFAYFYPPQGMHEKDHPYIQVFLTVTALYIGGIAMNAVVGWLFAIFMDQRDRFWRFFQASNWVALPAAIMGTPFIALAAFGSMPRAESDRMLLFLSCYMALVTACIAFRAFKINWQLAGFVACMSVFATQQAWNIVYLVQGLPLVWR